MRARRLVGVVGGVVALAVVPACGGGDGGGAGDRPAADRVQMRPVIDADVAPCTAPAVAFDAECLTLGPVEVDADTIESVAAGGPGELRIRFTAGGLIKYNKAAADSGFRRVAVFVDGVLVAAPAVEGIPLEPDVVVRGHVTPQQVESLVRAFPGDS
jgi:hypothetical protein